MHLLVKTLHGSRLYGLDNPQSDYDYKGIFLPSQRDCLLLRASRNTSDKTVVDGTKTEYEQFALQEFLALAARGEDVALCMLHAGPDAILENSYMFSYIKLFRNRFYTKTMRGALGYARSMAAKYALRADRMETVEKVIEILERFQADGVARLAQVWDMLPDDLPHTRKFENPIDRGADKRIYEVVGKGLPATVTPAYALDILYKVRDTYGERVKAARNMSNVDMKALSHSFRVGYQLKHIYQDGDFSFPLPETDFIRDIKESRLNYVTDGLDARLNDLIAEVEELAVKSNYPESVDQQWLDNIVLEAYGC